VLGKRCRLGFLSRHPAVIFQNRGTLAYFLDKCQRMPVAGEITGQPVEVERAAVELERARDEADEARGKLIPRKDLEAALSSIRDAWWRSAQVITSDLLAALPGLPIEAREQVRRAADAAIIKAAERVVSELTR
jgi:hypothetical protein